jgi:hypothetical protein
MVRVRALDNVFYFQLAPAAVVKRPRCALKLAAQSANLFNMKEQFLANPFLCRGRQRRHLFDRLLECVCHTQSLPQNNKLAMKGPH